MKLGRYGMGGKVTSLLQSIYYNDSVRFRVRKDLCKSIYLTRGVKQVKRNKNKKSQFLYKKICQLLGLQFEPCSIQPLLGRPVKTAVNEVPFNSAWKYKYQSPSLCRRLDFIWGWIT